MSKKCPGCNEHKDSNSFAKNSSRTDGLQTYCRLCKKNSDAVHYRKYKERQKERNRINRQKYREELAAYKSGIGCKYCNESESACLDFHHPNNDKESEVSKLISEMKITMARKESEKCDILCSNCHRKLHAGIIN